MLFSCEDEDISRFSNLYQYTFKDIIWQLFEQQIGENLVNYTEGKTTVSKRRILITKWLDTVWSKMLKKEDKINQNFKKCGLLHKIRVKIPIWKSRGWKTTKWHMQRKHMSSRFKASHRGMKRNKKIFDSIWFDKFWAFKDKMF